MLLLATLRHISFTSIVKLEGADFYPQLHVVKLFSIDGNKIFLKSEFLAVGPEN